MKSAQLLVPFPNLALSAHVLTDARLDRTIRISRMIQATLQGSTQFPEITTNTKKMWDGYILAAMLYGDLCMREWRLRGREPTSFKTMFTRTPTDDLPPAVNEVKLPPWIGDERVHLSHQRALLMTDPEHYAKWFNPEETKK